VATQDVTTGQIYRGIIPFVAIQLLGMLAVIAFPQLALWLPRLVFQ
jgi:TRAP-type mannitol/chloroaromatic compound transport system permease large subunit